MASMSVPFPRFGPNHDAVDSFIRSLDDLPWFTRVGQPTDRDDTLIRVNFDFVAAQHEDPYALWGTALPDAESRIEQVVFAHRRLREFVQVQEVITQRPPNRHIDEFFLALARRYPDYYGDTSSYAGELVEVPTRLVIGAAREIMVADVAPDLTFFQSLMPWLRMGHCPVGWGGVEWPKGELILW